MRRPCFLILAQALALYSASGTPLGRSAGDSNGEAMLGEHQHHRPLQQGDGVVRAPQHVGFPVRDPAASPEQIHIALAVSDTPDGYAVTVAWATWPEARSQVVWGSDSQGQDNIAYGRSTSECFTQAMPGTAFTCHTNHSSLPPRRGRNRCLSVVEQVYS